MRRARRSGSEPSAEARRFVIAPDWTQSAVDRFREWFARNARRLASQVALVVGVLLIIRGLIYLI